MSEGRGGEDKMDFLEGAGDAEWLLSAFLVDGSGWGIM
jgi:hypothetical protein